MFRFLHEVKKVSYRLENGASASFIRLIITLLSDTWQFEFRLTLRVGFFSINLRGNGRFRVYKNSTHSSLTCPFARPPHKSA